MCLLIYMLYHIWNITNILSLETTLRFRRQASHAYVGAKDNRSKSPVFHDKVTRSMWKHMELKMQAANRECFAKVCSNTVGIGPAQVPGRIFGHFRSEGSKDSKTCRHCRHGRVFRNCPKMEKNFDLGHKTISWHLSKFRSMAAQHACTYHSKVRKLHSCSLLEKAKAFDWCVTSNSLRAASCAAWCTFARTCVSWELNASDCHSWEG